MTIPLSLREALDKPSPAIALREAVLALKAAGSSRDEISDSLHRLLLEVRERGTDTDREEIILDTMDAVVGWCQPSARLYPESAA